MKNYLKKILISWLKYLSKAILDKYHPDIIAITGSVGKTSTKEAIFCVLEKKYRCRANIKNYNNEIGLPLTVLGEETGGKSFFRWINIFFKGMGLLILKKASYPEILILEMGADHPGDIQYLTSFIKPRIGVMTAVSATHLEFFKSIEAVAREKSILIKNLPPDGFAIINHDDRLVYEMKNSTKARVISFGFQSTADIHADDADLIIKRQEIGKLLISLKASIDYNGDKMEFIFKNLAAEHFIYAVLPAVVIGRIYKLESNEIIEYLNEWQPPKGRMNIIEGVKNTTIIDDTYNSSPLAARSALKFLKDIPAKSKKYAVFGDMLELGNITERAHQELGEAVFDYQVDYLISVGEIARDIARGAEGRGMPKDRIFSFPSVIQAGKFLQDRIEFGDIILVKGSQGARMEKIVKEIMAEPNLAKKLLVRQDSPWV